VNCVLPIAQRLQRDLCRDWRIRALPIDPAQLKVA
jgi:hypothetical protein